jgi:hypothetical protein
VIQDAWSIVDHKINYKHELSLPLKRRINRLAALFELADNEYMLIKDEADKEETNKYVKTNNDILTRDNSDQQLKITDNSSLTNADTPTLNAKSFIKILNDTEEYNHYSFYLVSVQDIVDEILKLENQFTVNDFKNSIEQNKDIISKYDLYLQETSSTSPLNPYTNVRHCLYVNDKEKFKEILRPWQRHNFDIWKKNSDT